MCGSSIGEHSSSDAVVWSNVESVMFFSIYVFNATLWRIEHVCVVRRSMYV